MDNDHTSEVDHSSYQQDDQQPQNQGDASSQDQIQYVQSGLEMAAIAADIASAFQPQQQQQQPPPQYQQRPPPQPLGGGQPQQPNFQQQPAAYPPQPQPPQAPRPMQYLAPQPPQQPQNQNQLPQQQYPPQSPQFQKPQQQSPFQQQPPQQYPPQNMQNNNNSPMYANASNQNHPFGQPPPSPVKTYPPSKQYQTPPVQVGYNKPVYPPAQQQMQQQQQPGTYYSPAPAPAQGVPMQASYGPQGTPMNPSMMQLQNMGTEAWSSGLFDFMQDPNNALITLFVPCLTFGQIAEVVDNGTTTCGTSALLYGLVAAFIGVPFIMSCTYRTKIRSKYGLVETPAPDWVTHLFCEPCALCQEYRELQYRGLDPSIGWQGNMAKAMQQQQPNMMNPPTNQMMR